MKSALAAVTFAAFLLLSTAQEDKRAGLAELDMEAEMAQLQRPRFGKRFASLLAQDEAFNKRQDFLDDIDGMNFQRPRFGRRK